MSTARDSQNELSAAGRRLRAAIPEVYQGYQAVHQAAMGDGALPAGVKELIALAIAVTRECDGCVWAHARAAARSGVTAEQVAEAMGVAILMNGGPGTVWGPRAYAAFEEYAGDAAARRGRATTGPPATGAAGANASATDSPATDSPATDSPATDSPATDSPATDSPATDSPATGTAGTGSAAGT